MHHFLAVGGLLAAALLLPNRAMAQEREGQALYQKSCTACHGATGKGDGQNQIHELVEYLRTLSPAKPPK